ncbi:MAG: NAD-dependent epimerase/dehydratase family protein [Candidatus Cloacimonetes bacterium]|nr:NAD-dependent epimerase/dehydratase family protein [Candidatus Cloacimonadota bacterium]
MRILITGSNGFVGSRLMWHYGEQGHEVHGIDRSPDCMIEPHPNTVQGDICNLADYAPFEHRKFDLLIHCAAAKHDFGIGDAEYYRDNEEGTRQLMRWAGASISRVIYYSTVSVYGHQSAPCDETAPFEPNTVYGSSKLAGEVVIEQWQQQDASRQVVFLRPTIIFGPHNYANMYNLIDMLHRRPWVTVGKGEHIKSMVSLANLVDMTDHAIGLLKPGIEAYNCIDTPYITVRGLMEHIAAQQGFRMPRVCIPLGLAIGIGRLFDVLGKLLRKDLPINSDRMKKFATSTDYKAEKLAASGYVQRHATADELARTCAWYLRHKR